jgi:3-oxoacyl-[acyl-carrier-protein] synthase-1
MIQSPYILSALGMVNALGTDTETIWRRLVAGDQSALSLWDGVLPGKMVRVGRAPVEDSAVPFPSSLKPYHCRNNVLILKAFEQIADRVRAVISLYGSDRVGVVMGSSTAGVASTEAAFAARRLSGEFPASFCYVQHELGGVAEFVSQVANIQGPSYTLSTACSSSAKAFASARALLREGWCDAVLVGGADSLCRLTVEGFLSLEALSSQPSNSMSRNRDGFVVGEGATLFVLERGDNGIELCGIGESSDAHHMSAPLPEGQGAAAAMSQALNDAGLTPDQIHYINLHGTGTLLNDQMEARAVASLFPHVPASSSKGMIGHTLGAAGAMEVGVCWLALSHEHQGRVFLPPHCWDGHPDDQLPPLHLVPLQDRIELTQKTAFLTNSFGFGGSNCAIVIGKSNGS